MQGIYATATGPQNVRTQPEIFREHEVLLHELEKLKDALPKLFEKIQPVCGLHAQQEQSKLVSDKEPALSSALARHFFDVRVQISEMASQVRSVTDDVQL